MARRAAGWREALARNAPGRRFYQQAGFRAVPDSAQASQVGGRQVHEI